MLAYWGTAGGLTAGLALGALLDAGANGAMVARILAGLTLPRATLVQARGRANGLAGTVATVALSPVPHGTPFLHAIHALENGTMPLAVRTWGGGALRRLVEAEALVRGMPVDAVPLVDPTTVAEIIAVTAALATLRTLRVFAAPLCARPSDDAHAGDVAGALLDEAGWPAAIDGEAAAISPGGAALLAALCEPGQPPMRLVAIGYGMTADSAVPPLPCWLGEPYHAEVSPVAAPAPARDHPHPHPHGDAA